MKYRPAIAISGFTGTSIVFFNSPGFRLIIEQVLQEYRCKNVNVPDANINSAEA
jgi:hypothetical protein